MVRVAEREGPQADAEEGRQQTTDNQDAQQDDQGHGETRSGHADQSLLAQWEDHRLLGAVLSVNGEGQVTGGDHPDDPVQADLLLGVVRATRASSHVPSLVPFALRQISVELQLLLGRGSVLVLRTG